MGTDGQDITFPLVTGEPALRISRGGKPVLSLSKRTAERSRYSVELLRNLKNFKVCKVTRLI